MKNNIVQEEESILTLPPRLEIGNWVFDKQGKLWRINDDDMPDLVYENIDRLATEAEIPEFNFVLVAGENLGLDNFWNPFHKRCRFSIGYFFEYIEAYEKKVKWKTELFNHGSPHYKDMGWHNPRFFNIPFEMQFGIICDFFSITQNYFLDINWKDRNEAVQSFICDFVQMEVQHRNGNISK